MADLARNVLAFFGRLATRNIDAAQAFGTPPTNARARRCAAVALILFLSASALLVIAALLHTVAGAPALSYGFGFAGIVCLQICVFCGHRYAAVNAER